MGAGLESVSSGIRTGHFEGALPPRETQTCDQRREPLGTDGQLRSSATHRLPVRRPVIDTSSRAAARGEALGEWKSSKKPSARYLVVTAAT
jgi:hypothetical protein